MRPRRSDSQIRPLHPRALFDLKTGISGIGEVWDTRLRTHLPTDFEDIPVIEIRG